MVISFFFLLYRTWPIEHCSYVDAYNSCCCYFDHYEPRDINHWTAASSAKWRCGRPPSSLVCGQLLMIWNIVWRLPHWHLQGPTFCGRLVSLKMVYIWRVLLWQIKSWVFGCRIVGSCTIEELTTKADFQSSCHWLVTSIKWVSVQRRLRDDRQLREGENIFV